MAASGRRALFLLSSILSYPSMARCLLALGGNLGDVQQTFAQAVRALQQEPAIRLLRQSSLYRTSPVGERAGGQFRNAALEVQTEISPRRLLQLAKRLEAEYGRINGERWGPRPLDVDLIFYGRQVVDEPDLQVPHPACWYRRFVLDPLAEIAPEAWHPVKGLTVAALHRRLLPRPLKVALAGGTEMLRNRIVEALRGEFPPVEFCAWAAGGADLSTEPTFVVWLGHAAAISSGKSEWESLPVVPRLKLTDTGDPVASLRDVLQSATGEPVPTGPIPGC